MSRTTYNVVDEYTGTGGLKVYTFDFKITDLSQLLIIESDTAGVETQRVRGTDIVYLDPAAPVTFDPVVGGGTVSLTNSLILNYNLKLVLADDAPTQPAELNNKGAFILKTIEGAFDRLSGQIQRLTYLADRSFKLRDQDDASAINTITVKPVGNELLGWNTAGTAIIGYTPSSIAAAAGGLVDTDALAEGVVNFYYLDSKVNTRIAASTLNTLSPTTTTKGDLLVRDATDVKRIGIGSNDQILTADSTLSLGLGWKTRLNGDNVRSVVVTDTATVADDTLLLSGATFIQTLPSPVGIAGKKFKMVHRGTSITEVYTISATGLGTYALYTNGEILEVESDGTNYFIGDRFAETDWAADTTMVITSTGTDPTKGTTSLDYITWRRSGSEAFVKYGYKQGAGGVAGTGLYQIGTPGGLIIDTTRDPVYAGVTVAISYGYHLQSYHSGRGTAPDGLIARLWPYSSTLLAVSGDFQASSLRTWGQSTQSFVENPLEFKGECRVNIAGWKP